MSQKSVPIDIQDLEDIQTPFGIPLAGIYKRSFAYITIKDRLPVILTKVIDSLSRNKDNIRQKYGENALEELKQIIGFISKLKNEIVTNKTLKPLRLLPNATDNDAEEWNKYLMKRTEIEGGTPTWFNTVWLYCECYMYRALAQEIILSTYLHDYDIFEQQKHSSFTDSIGSIQTLCSDTMNVVRKAEFMSISEAKEEFFKFLQLSLWSNTCDLSLSAGAEVSQNSNPLRVLKSLEENILVDNSQFVWNLLRKKDTNYTCIIDIVLDNAGYEFFTDLCLMMFLVARNLAGKIRFYVKRYPWYISDATTNDIHWTIDYMKNSSNEDLREFAQLANQHLQNNVWTIEEESYWTGPYDFAAMREQDQALYAKLSEAKLAVFKGDLNYRKLLGDINFEYTTEFIEALRGFQPTHILSVRTVKSDVCVGLPVGVADSLYQKNEKWMYTGHYGLIQTTLPGSCQCSRPC